MLDGIARHGISLPRSLELGAQWRAVLAAGPQCPLCRTDSALDPVMGLLLCFGACVLSLHSRLSEFLLQPDMVPPSPFLSCDPGITPGGSGWFYLTLLILMSSLERLGFPSSVGHAEELLTLLFSMQKSVAGCQHLRKLMFLLWLDRICLMLFRKRSLLLVALVGGVGGSSRAFLLLGLTDLP